MAEDSTNTSIMQKPKPPVFGGLKKGIALQRHQAEATLKEIDPTKVENRIGIIMDDSGSMSGKPIEDAHLAIKNFTLSCNFNDTSIAVYPLNANSKPLTVDYDLVNLYVGSIGATGDTRLYSKLGELKKNEDITRAVVFSDGSPTDYHLESLESDSLYAGDARKFIKNIIDMYVRPAPLTSTPIDTVFIGFENTIGYKEMKELAKITGGEFIHFKDSLSLSTGLKYLAPRYRALLANSEIKERIQKGETI